MDCESDDAHAGGTRGAIEGERTWERLSDSAPAAAPPAGPLALPPIPRFRFPSVSIYILHLRECRLCGCLGLGHTAQSM